MDPIEELARREANKEKAQPYKEQQHERNGID